MKILFLYNNSETLRVAEWLRTQGNKVVCCNERITQQDISDKQYDYAVSYSYRYIITQDVINSIHGNVINMHISYLPWNRGADPNIWSWIENSPKGVSIHYVNAGLDKGNIIAQRIVAMEENETLKSSYIKLSETIFTLLREIYPYIDLWREMQKEVHGKGSYHCLNDLEQYRKLITDYDIPVKEFVKAVREQS